MSNLNELSSDSIRERLKESGIKQVHLARKLGVSPQHLNKILSRNQERGQYMSKMAALLGMDEFSVPSITRLIPLFIESDLKSLASNATSFDNLAEVAIRSCPSFIPDDHACFGYALTENISSHCLKQDILIFSTRLPLHMTGDRTHGHCFH